MSRLQGLLAWAFRVFWPIYYTAALLALLTTAYVVWSDRALEWLAMAVMAIVVVVLGAQLLLVMGLGIYGHLLRGDDW